MLSSKSPIDPFGVTVLVTHFPLSCFLFIDG